MQTKEAIAEQWLERVLRTYPSQTARFLTAADDPFRNPVGHTLKQALGILLDELFLAMDGARVTAALDSIVQIRAVADSTPGHALEFLFQLKGILRDHVPEADLDLLSSRIDEMALAAFDLYVKYREKTYEAKANEARRRVFALERRMAPREPAAWRERDSR